MSELHGRSLIAGETVGGGGKSFRAFNPSEGQEFGPVFYEATPAEIDRALVAAAQAFPEYRQKSAEEVAGFLERIALQIEPDGREPLELERTRGWSYSIMNLDLLMQLAMLGDAVGIDLWNYQTADGRSIRRAIEYLYPFAVGEKWKYQQLGEWQPQALYPLMRRAGAKYHDDKFKAMLAKIPSADASGKENLVLAKY